MKKVHNQAIQAYQKYYIDRDYEQVDLFRLLKAEYGISSAIYPGSYIQVSPSFIFPHVVYIDSDQQAIRFFKGESLGELVAGRKEYPRSLKLLFTASITRNSLKNIDRNLTC